MRTKSSGSSRRLLSRLVADIRPLRTDDGQHRRAAADDLVQVPAKILPQRNRIHILEHARLAELGHEAVVDAARGIRVVAAAIADEDARQFLRSLLTCRHRGSSSGSVVSAGLAPASSSLLIRNRPSAATSYCRPWVPHPLRHRESGLQTALSASRRNRFSGSRNRRGHHVSVRTQEIQLLAVGPPQRKCRRRQPRPAIVIRSRLLRRTVSPDRETAAQSGFPDSSEE